MAIKLKNSRNIGRMIIILVLAICSVGMMLTYWWTSDELDEYVPARADTESILASLSDNLSAGNYIMDKDVYGDIDVLDMQEEYYAFGLLRKYMDCAVFDEDGELLTSGVDSKRAERLKDEETDYYAFRVEYTFSGGGEISGIQVSGSALTPEQEYDLETRFLESAGSYYYMDEQSISNETIIYGMTQESLTEYMSTIDFPEPGAWDIMYTNFHSRFMTFFLIIAASALLLPFVKVVGERKGKIFRAPFEAALIGIFIALGCADACGNMVYHTIKGGLIRTPIYTLNTAADIVVNFLVWMAVAALIFWSFTCLRSIFTMRRSYWRERTLTVRVIRWIKGDSSFAKEVREFFRGQYDALLHLDFRSRTNRKLLKLVIVNFVILVIISCFWFYGIFALILYSVLLFLFLRKYMGDLQKKYSLLLQSTNQLADGRLDVPIEGDMGLFNPVKDELKKIQAGFKKAVDEEVKNERMKTELVTNVSHDLRTPLTAIITYIDLLKNEKDEEKQKEYIEVLERKSLRLKVLIEDLFEISKAASKSVTMHFMKVDIVDLLKQVGLENDSKIKNANLEFRWKLPDYKLVMWLDSEKTYRIFENLIVNITKYAMPHTRVYIEMKELENEVQISMKNVSADELNFNVDEITDRFVRGDSSRNTEGSGLGLAIAKSFVELQHGRLKISTEADLFKADIMLPKTDPPEETENLQSDPI